MLRPIQLSPLSLALMARMIAKVSRGLNKHYNQHNSVVYLMLVVLRRTLNLTETMRRARWFADIGSPRGSAATSRNASSCTQQTNAELVLRFWERIPMSHFLTVPQDEEEARTGNR
jgi:hypothetical protein